MTKSIFLLFIFLPTLLFAQKKQGAEYVDSLVSAISSVNDDTNKVNLYNSLSDAYINLEPDKGIKYGKEGLALSEKLTWKEGIAKMNGSISQNYFSKSDYPSALTYWLNALQIYEELGNKKEIATVYVDIGNIYCMQKNFQKALEYFQKALSINETLQDKGNIALISGDMGNVSVELKNYEKALYYFNKALEINQQKGNISGTVFNIGNIGTIYFAQEKYPEALENYFKALKFAAEVGDKGSQAINLGNIGECYYLIAKDSTGQIKADSLVPATKKANLQKSLEYLQKAIKMSKEINFHIGVDEFWQYLSQAQTMAGDYKAALASFQQYTNAKDSIYNTENNVKITNLETKRELDLKDKQLVIDKLAVEKKRNERWAYIAALGVMLLIIIIIIWNYKRLSTEQQKSEHLLLNILPAEVANELKEKGNAEAKLFDEVTVLFTDFVGFSKISESLTPQQLVNELDTCFKAFDTITSKYNIEKIKTVGDAYLAVCGLPLADPLHGINVTGAAIEIMAFMNDRKKAIGALTFEVRIGVHSGSVVAGIVGSRKFAYDIWGDTVNIAARMEQNSHPGKINISETTFELVKNDFSCEYRGEIEAKNKGALKMYFVS